MAYFSMKSISFLLRGIHVTTSKMMPAEVEQIAEDTGPPPLRIRGVSPKLFAPKNNSFVSKTNTAHAKKSKAKTVLIAASFAFHAGLNDSIIKTIANKNGKINPKIGAIVPL